MSDGGAAQDDDGFTYYCCSECGARKMAALFTPEEIAGRRRCRLCLGELTTNANRSKTPMPSQQPRTSYIHRNYPPAPRVFKR